MSQFLTGRGRSKGCNMPRTRSISTSMELRSASTSRGQQRRGGHFSISFRKARPSSRSSSARTRPSFLSSPATSPPGPSTSLLATYPKPNDDALKSAHKFFSAIFRYPSSKFSRTRRYESSNSTAFSTAA